MISLRLLSRDKQHNIKIRECIDFAYVLYGKGLHMQALDILAKAKKMSIKHYNDFSLLTIIEMEKMIHARHITRSKSEPIKELIEESIDLSTKVVALVDLSNVRMQLHKLYIEHGHIDDADEQSRLRSFFSDKMRNIESNELKGLELIYYFQSYVWYYYILDEFDHCLEYSIKWVQAFKNSKELQIRDIDLFMRGYHYVLTSSFNLKDVKIYEIYLIELEKIRRDQYSKLNINSQIVSFQYTHNGRMNLHFLKGTFSEGLLDLPSTEKRIKRYSNKLDPHKIMIINYKMAWMYLGGEQPNRAIEHLSYIINMTDRSLRDDIQCYARLMHIIANYDAENYGSINRLTKAAQQFVRRSGFHNEIVNYTLELILDMSKTPLLDRRPLFEIGYHKLVSLAEHKVQRRALIYLDILPWVYGKYKKVNLHEATKVLNGLKLE